MPGDAAKAQSFTRNTPTLTFVNLILSEDVSERSSAISVKFQNGGQSEKIAVALSGERTASLYCISFIRYSGIGPDLNLIAITIDEGIKGYRENTLEHAIKLHR